MLYNREWVCREYIIGTLENQGRFPRGGENYAEHKLIRQEILGQCSKAGEQKIHKPGDERVYRNTIWSAKELLTG